VAVPIVIACSFNWTLTSRFDNLLSGVTVSERVTIDFLNSIPKRFMPIAKTGKAVTNVNGQITDTYSVPIIGSAPINTDIKATQTINAAGYKGNNSIDMFLTSIVTTNPVSLE